MKKTGQYKSQANIDIDSNKIPEHQSKTTNINILLNRVRADKKKTFKKKLLVSIIFLFLISLLIAHSFI